MSQKVARNVFSLVLAKVFSALLVFIGYASIFRYLGTFATGQFQFVLSFVMLFSIIVDFGISQMVIKRVSENTEDSKKYLGNFFAVEMFLALFIYELMIVIAAWRHYDPIIFHAILLTGFGMFLNALSTPYTAILSGYQDMHKIAIVNFFDSVINVAIMFAAIIFHRWIVFLCSVQMLMGIMHFFVYNKLIRQYVPRPSLWAHIKNLDFTLVKSMLISAAPFGMLIGFSIIYNKIDVLILASIRGYAETGLYTAAYKFFDVLAFLPAVVSSSLYPFFSQSLSSKNIDAVRTALSTYTRYMIALALPIAFGGAVLAPKLMVLVAGQSFYSGYVAVEILVFASATLFIYSAVNSLMVNQLTKYALVITFLNIFINSIGNLLLIPRFGFRAAAIMTLVSELTQASLYFYFVQTKIVRFKILGAFIKPLICAGIMAALIYPIRAHSLLITLPLGLVIYGTLLLATRFTSINEMRRIKNLLRAGTKEINAQA